MRRRFFLCDPSIEERGGHYLTYARRVLTAAQSAGFQPVLVTNRSFRLQEDTPWEVRALFQFNCWRRRSVVAALPGQSFSSDDRGFLRLKYSFLGLCWANAGSLTEFRRYNEAFPLPARQYRRLKRVHRVRELAEMLAAPTAGVATESSDATQTDIRAAAYRQLRARIIEAARLLAAQAVMVSSLPSGPSPLDKVAVESLEALDEATIAAETFAQALAELDREFVFTTCDHVFLPTTTANDLSGLRTALLRDPNSRNATYHLLFRRNAYDGYGDNFDAQEWPTHPLRVAFTLFREVAGKLKVRFYTDTDALTAQYNRFDAAPFGTLPIPVEVITAGVTAPRLIEPEPIAPPGLATCKSGGPYRIAILPQGERGNWLAPLAHMLADLGALLGGGATLFEVVNPGLLGVRGRTLLYRLIEGHPGQIRWVDNQEFGQPLDKAISRFDLAILAGDNADSALREDPVLAAVAAGVPIVVGHTANAAAVLTQAAVSYHERSLVDAVLVEDLGASPSGYSWREYHGNGEDRDAPNACDQNGMRIHDDPTMYLWLSVPPDASHVWVAFDRTGSPWAATALVLSFQNPADQRRILSESEIIISTRHDGLDGIRGSIVRPVPAGAGNLWLGLRSIAGSDDDRLPYFQVRWMRANARIAALPGGLTYCSSGSPDQVAQQLASAIRSILLDRPAYHTSLQDLATHCQRLRAASGRPGHDDAAAGERRVIAYLGDARREKGFHHLPVLQSAVSARHGEKVHFVVQSYLTSLDTSILLARERLRQARGAVELVEQALDDHQYGGLLSATDIVLIPYQRQNYIARSSGIFAEALANGKPVVVPSGTWMADCLNSFSWRYHEARLSGRVVSELEISTATWLLLNGQQVEPLSHSGGTRRLPVFHHQTTFTIMPLERDVTHVWITFRHCSQAADPHTRIVLALVPEATGGEPLDRCDIVVGGHRADLVSVVLPARDATAGYLWLGLYNPYTEPTHEAEDLRVRQLRSPRPIPILAGGVTYHEDGDDRRTTENLAAAVDLLLSGYDEYRDSAAAIALEWSRFHSADALVALLQQADDRPSGRLPSGRLFGREWGGAGAVGRNSRPVPGSVDR